MKTAYLFPGQGAQFMGMGIEIAERYPVVEKLYHRASAVLGFDLFELCRTSPTAILQQTQNAQPAIFVTSFAHWQMTKDYLPRPSFLAGLSLGEYTALMAAGAFNFEEAVFLVRQRGLLMQNSTVNRATKMAAIIGLEANAIADICQEASILGLCQPTNYNAPGQTVIGGDLASVNWAISLAEQAGAHKVVTLKVSGAFHTSLMQSAAEEMKKLLAKISIRDLDFPVISNVNGKPVRRAKDIRSLLVQQMTCPVRWSESMTYLANYCIDTCIEFGPGKTLSGLLKRNLPDVSIIDPKADIFPVQTLPH